MTDKNDNLWMHALADGLTVMAPPSATGRVLSRGDEVELTAAFLKASVDSNGDSIWPWIIDDDEAQIRRWGRIHVRPGRVADDPELAAALAAEAELMTEDERLRRVREARRYGRSGA